jgi:hypothetical protein
VKASKVLTIRAGLRARATIRERGLLPSDIDAIPAAAGGPKGLGLLGLDQFIFGEWLKGRDMDGKPGSIAGCSAARPALLLVGASIGAWRLAACAQDDCGAALARLAHAYAEQRYPSKPTPHEVSIECRHIVESVLGSAPRWHPHRQLAVVTSRSRGILRERYGNARFLAAALANATSRKRLAHFLSRVTFIEGDHAMLAPFDAFGGTTVALDDRNRCDALLASGTIPLLADPIRDPAGAPPGLYWDGGLIDYHLAWPWHRLPGLVLYPHFTDHIVPGWLDKSLPWRRATGAALENVILVAPSREFLAQLPMGKLPDRKDFYRFGVDHDGRIASWKRAMSECQRLADAFAELCRHPDAIELHPL